MGKGHGGKGGGGLQATLDAIWGGLRATLKVGVALLATPRP
jgi:hypothetical protein